MVGKIGAQDGYIRLRTKPRGGPVGGHDDLRIWPLERLIEYTETEIDRRTSTDPE